MIALGFGLMAFAIGVIAGMLLFWYLFVLVEKKFEEEKCPQ